MYEAKSMSRVAKSLRITVGTLTVAVNNLKKKGYVEMAAMQSDKQNKLLRLTDFGKKLADEVIGKFCQKTCVI